MSHDATERPGLAAGALTAMETNSKFTVNVEQAAEILHCHPQTVMQLARKGEIRGRKIGRRWVFLVQDLLDYISGGQDTGPCPSSNTPVIPTGTRASRRQTDVAYLKALGLPASGKKPRSGD